MVPDEAELEHTERGDGVSSAAHYDDNLDDQDPMSEKYDRSRSLDLRSGSQPIPESRFASSSTSVIKKMMWNSRWLSVPVLLAFSLIFILLAVGTAGAYSFSVEHSGFHVPMNVLHYAWTLAPTFGEFCFFNSKKYTNCF